MVLYEAYAAKSFGYRRLVSLRRDVWRGETYNNLPASEYLPVKCVRSQLAWTRLPVDLVGSSRADYPKISVLSLI